ncbi:MAG: hypothetical protein AAGF86_16960, partial [Pseudomonadota bacterium]
MSFELIIRGATLPDGRSGLDIAARDGRIVTVEPNLEAEAVTVIEAEGMLVSPPFVDPHFHMDATLSLGRPRLSAIMKIHSDNTDTQKAKFKMIRPKA